MKKAIVLLLTLFVVFAFCGCDSKENEKISPDNQQLYTSFTALDLEGYPADQSVFADYKVTMVNVWGTYCGPCIKEMPDIAKLSKNYADKGFQVVGIPIDVVDRNFNNIPDIMSKAKQIIADTGADYMHLIPSKSLNEAHLSAVMSIPETVFVDKNGMCISEIYVGAKSYDEWESIIKELLEKQK